MVMGKGENFSPAAAGILDLSVEEYDTGGGFGEVSLHDTPGEEDLQKDQQTFSRGRLGPSGQEYYATMADQNPPWNRSQWTP